MDLSAVAVELYTLAPSEFTAARNARAKEAKAAGDAELARRISSLPKPSTAAWTINMLAKHRAAEIDNVVDLGAALLKAQQEQDRSGLRELGQQRSRVLASAVREARDVAGGLGVKVSEAAAEEVGDTLWAAMADPQAAEAVRSGLLVRSLSSDGLEPADLEGALAVPEILGVSGTPSGEGGVPDVEEAADVGRTPAGGGRQGAKQRQSAQQRREDKQSAEEKRREEQAKREEARKREDERKREELRTAVEEAERSADEAEADLEEAESQLTEAVSRRDHLSGEIAAAKDRLAALEEDLAAAERFARIAEKNHKLAGRLAAQERQNAQRERERLEKLRN